MAFVSSPELLVLHTVRIKGTASTDEAARRFSIARTLAQELLLDFEANGWVQHAAFADLAGWSLTDTGRAENERQLSAELDEAGVRSAVAAACSDFVSLNGRFLKAITDWQIRPTSWDPVAQNDHSDFRWDDRVLATLGSLSRKLQPVCLSLTDVLPRFSGYADRFSAALDRATRGNWTWVDKTGIDSCHTVWFELHEDLVATLNLERGQEVSSR